VKHFIVNGRRVRYEPSEDCAFGDQRVKKKKKKRRKIYERRIEKRTERYEPKEESSNIPVYILWKKGRREKEKKGPNLKKICSVER